MHIKKYAKFLMVSLLKALYILICFFPIKRKGKITFYSYPDASDNSWYVYNFLAKNYKNKLFIWLCENPKEVKRRLEKPIAGTGNDLLVKGKRSIAGVCHFCTSDFAFTTTTFYPFFIPGHGPTVVGVWHGMPIKTIGTYKGSRIQSANFDYLVSTSELFTRVMGEAFELDQKAIINSGLPRNDALLSFNSEMRDDIFCKLKIADKSKLLFWLPTYRISDEKYGLVDSKSSKCFLDDWEDGFLSRLNETASHANTVVIIKLHPADQLNSMEQGDEYTNVRLLTSRDWECLEIDLYHALSVSDALISDVSSVLVDYMVRKKPIAVTVSMLSSYDRGLIEDVAPMLEYFYQIESEDELLTFVEGGDELELLDATIYEQYNSQAVSRMSACKELIDVLGVT